MRFEAIAGVRPSLGRAPCVQPLLASVPSTSLGSTRRSEGRRNRSELCATHVRRVAREVSYTLLVTIIMWSFFRASCRKRVAFKNSVDRQPSPPLSPAGFPSKEETRRSNRITSAGSRSLSALSRSSPDPPETHDAMPRSTAATLLVALAICTAAVGVSAQTHELHGSGTTNPSKFFWKVMDLMEERSRTPITMTYRAVGASRTTNPTNPTNPPPSPRHVASLFSRKSEKVHTFSGD